MHQYGIIHIWQQGDFVIRAIALILLLMSVMSWTVIAVKGYALLRLRHLRDNADHDFWHSENIESGIAKLNRAHRNPFLDLALAGQEAAAHHHQTQPHLHDKMSISDWLTRCLRSAMDQSIAEMQAGLSVLASIGSTAPFVGLFGTVWGIYHALVQIGETGQTSIDQVAGPVGEALIMTAFGWFVAIPAVLGFNALTRGNKATTTRLNRFAHGLHAYFVTGAHPAYPDHGRLTLAPLAPSAAATASSTIPAASRDRMA
jgi:biopolymer transport protein ExbB